MGEVVRIRPKLTRADIVGRKTTNAMHLDFDRRRSAWTYGVEGIPRLTVWDESGPQGSSRTWLVDGKRCPDLEAALAVLNGDKTWEEVVAEAQAQTAKKISLNQQIEEVRYELEQRAKVYPRIASSEPRRRAELEYHVARMEAALQSLLWLEQHRDQVIAWLDERKADKPTTPAAC